MSKEVFDQNEKERLTAQAVPTTTHSTADIPLETLRKYASDITPQMIRDKRRELEVATRRSYWDAEANPTRMALEIELAQMVETARQQWLERRGK